MQYKSSTHRVELYSTGAGTSTYSAVRTTLVRTGGYYRTVHVRTGSLVATTYQYYYTVYSVLYIPDWYGHTVHYA